jgi:sulfate adenylyltransferase
MSTSTLRENTSDSAAAGNSPLIAPYGGELVDLILPREQAAELKSCAAALPSIRLSARNVCDLEMLATGAFSPLDRFMNRADYFSVLDEMRLSAGHVFPIPVTFQVNPSDEIIEGAEVALRDSKNNILAVMTVEEVYEWDRGEYMQKVLGTTSRRHPLVAEMQNWGSLNVSGRLRVIELPRYYDFPELRMTPARVRTRLEEMNAGPVVAFQTRNPLHRAHEELTKRAVEKTGGTLLMHPVVGLTKPGDIDYYSRVRTYKVLTEKYYDAHPVLLALLPLAMRLAGPREALWHAMIRRNYGADHLIIGRDHASPGSDENGDAFYGPYAAQETVEKFSGELGVNVIPFREFVYLPDEARYEESSKVPAGKVVFSLSGTQVKEEYLYKGLTLPDWFTRVEVARILEEAYPPRTRQGFCIWFTGLSGAGKSTTAEILTENLVRYGRRVTLLDGDVVRTHLSTGLGFDKDGRDANIRRIGFVAAEIVRHGGVAVCAAVSPYSAARAEARKMVGDNFIEVFVDTPLEVCEERDTKGMYAKARRGEIKDFTGIDDVYEVPQNAEITLLTTGRSAEENVSDITAYLLEKNFIG